MRRQLINLTVLVLLNFLVWRLSLVIRDQPTGESMVSDYIHYALLGYFASSYWFLILGSAFIYEIYKDKTDYKKVIRYGIVHVFTVKFVGLLTGMLLNLRYPMRINLWSYIRRELF